MRERQNIWQRTAEAAGRRARRQQLQSQCPHAATRMVTRYGDRILFCIACGTVTHREREA